MNLMVLPIIILFSIPFIFVYGESEPDPDFMIYKGTQYNKLGEYEKAISIFEKVLKKDHKNVQALTNLADSYLLLEKYYAAIAIYEHALKTEPNNSFALYGLQEALLQVSSYRFGFLDGVLEIKVHDPHGGLVAFQQTSKISALSHSISENFVNSWSVSKMVHRNNQDYFVHQQEFVEAMEHNTILGFHEIPFSDKMDLPLASTWHYQIPVEKGDVVSYVYSFYRPIE